MILYLDRETKSEYDLTEVGTYEYARNASDLLVTYAIDEEPAQLWDPYLGPPPDELVHACEVADEVWAHYAIFDRNIHRNQSALPQIELSRWRCSLSLALSHALPGSLSELCQVLNVPEDMGKLKSGKKLIRLFCMPQPANRKTRWCDRFTHPAEWEEFCRYALNDVTAMRECMRLIPRWNWDDTVVAEYHFDQRMNDRGFAVDQELVHAGARAAVAERARLAQRFREITLGVVDRPSQRAQFMAYLNDRFGLDLDNTRSDTFQQLMKGELDKDCRELMEISVMSNKTSTAKYAALEPAISPDGRFRGGQKFSGASRTRRQNGVLYQPLNLPSRRLPKPVVVEQYIADLKAGVHDLFHTDLMLLGAASLRGVIVAPKGKKVCVADLSNIEGRMLAWFANEAWKLKAFREYDTFVPDGNGGMKRLGPDLYSVTASSILGGSPWEVAKVDRDVFGKVPDLASGYQGGVAGYQKFAKTYGVRMADHWITMQKTLAPDLIERARSNLKTWGYSQLESLEISEDEWLASESCKLAWRERHPATVKFWYTLQDAMKDAIRNPGQTYSVGQYLKVKRCSYKGFSWLLIRLPSGRMLTYFEPHLVRGDRKRRDGSYEETIAYYGEATEAGKTTRHWVKNFTHGGKATGNCCQSTARDILFPALMNAEKHGYLPILSVHDEGLTEVPDTDEFSHEGLIQFLATNPEWAPGLPLAAAGISVYRYEKG